MKLHNNFYFVQLINPAEKNFILFLKKKINKKKTLFFKSIEKKQFIKLNSNLDISLKNIFNNFVFCKKQNGYLLDVFSILLIKNKAFSLFFRNKQFLYSLVDLIKALREEFFFFQQQLLFNSNSILKSKSKIYRYSKSYIFFNFFSLIFKKMSFIWYLKIFIKCYAFSLYNNYKSIVILKISNFNKNLGISFFNTKILMNCLVKLFFKHFRIVFITFNILFYQNYFKSFFELQQESFFKFKNRNYFLTFVNWNINKTPTLINSLWKKSYNLKNKINFYIKYKNKLNLYDKKLRSLRFISKNIFFILFKLQEKNIFLNLDVKNKKRLNLLKSLLAYKIKNKLKFQRSNNYIITTMKKVNILKFNKKLNLFVKNSFNFGTKLNNFNIKNQLCVSLKKPRFKRINTSKKKFSWDTKKLVNSGIDLKFNQINSIFSCLIQHKISLFFVNALGLVQFSFIFILKRKLSKYFLRQVDREMISRYKYVAIYIQDLIRISFFSLFFKNPTFLALFIGFQISKLPKNRKESSLIRFIIKVIRIFSSQRKEMIGLKIEFKGRINRWRRTKILRGVGGVLPSLYDYKSKVEYGSGKSITRKGALGIRLWFCYKAFFKGILRNFILKYFLYSKYLRVYTIKRFLKNFESKN